MHKNQIIELYSYNDWANYKTLDAVGQLEKHEFFQDLSSSFKSIQETMLHILGAEELWLSRWKGEEGRTLLNPVNFPTYSSLVDRWDEYKTKIDSYTLSLTEEDLTQVISYKNLQGVSYSLELWKQMLHVTNHSSYHRGQVTTMLRQLKKQPPSLDLIYYYVGER